jgi:predicted porin
LAARLERPQTTLNLAYAPRYFLPGNRPEDATLDHNLTFRAGWNPTPRLNLALAEDFTKSTDFRDLDDPGSRRTGTAGFTRNEASVEAAHTPIQGTAALRYTNVLVHNDGPGADDSLTHILRANADLTGPRLSLGGTYTLTRGEFDIASPYWEHAVEARARRAISPTASLTLTAGFTHHDQERGEDFMGGRGRIGGTFALGPDGLLDVSGGAEIFAPRGRDESVRSSVSVAWTQRFALFSLSLQYTDGFQLRFQTVDNTGVTGSRSAALVLTSLAFRDLAANLGVRWTENRFEQTTLAGGPAGTTDRTWDIEAGLRYNILRPLSVSLAYTFTIRTSTTPTAEFYENRVRFGLTYQHSLF